MNFRTTTFLFVLLVAAALVYYVTSGRDSGKDAGRTAKTDDAAKKLLTIDSPDVKRVVVVAHASGERVAFERAGTSEWRIVEPVQAPAEGSKVDDLVREVTELRSRGQVEPGDKGVDTPQYTVELAHGDNKTTTVKVGNRSPVGDMLYIRLDDEKQADIVSASIIEQLDKPASDYRKARLLDVTNDQITGLTVSESGKTLRLQKAADNKWQIVEPSEMPGDDTQISALLSAVTGLNAVQFVAEDAKNAAGHGLNKPSMTVTFTTDRPATQPTTDPAGATGEAKGGAKGAATKPTTAASAANTTTIKFGRADVQKQNVYAMVSGAGPIVTVAAKEVEGLKKTPLDLRDRTVLDIEAEAISRVTLSIDRGATTQPTSQPAEKRELVLERRSAVTEVGPPAPATAPAKSAPATPAPAPKEGAAPRGGTKEGDAPESDAAATPATAEPTADAPEPDAPPPSNAPEADAPKGRVPGANAPEADAPADAPKSEPQSAPQPRSRATSPDGRAMVTLAAFQDQPAPAESKPAEPKPADPAPADPAPGDPAAGDPAPGDPAPGDPAPGDPAPADAAPATPGPAPAAEPQPSSTAGDKTLKDNLDAPEATQSVRDAVAAVAGRATAATQPTTSPAGAPATQPAVPPSKWLIASEPKGEANDAHVQALVDALRPLRAQKYLEAFPTTQAKPAGTYLLKISTRAWGDDPAREHEIKITDPGGQAPLIAQWGDLVFELDRAFLDKLTADFTEPNMPDPAGPPGGPEGVSPDLLRQFGAPPGPPPGQ